jgi:hypothetical protein
MDSKCYFVKLMAIYSNKILYGYKCNLEDLYDQLRQAKRYYILEENIVSCGLYGEIIDEINKFKRKLDDTFTTYCRDCEETSDSINCSDIVTSISSSFNPTTIRYTFTATTTNATNPITYNWSYDPSYWTLISKSKNKLVLAPAISSGLFIYTNIGISIYDSNNCLSSTSVVINYHAGCTDPEATNYDATAIINNNVCIYPDPPG